MITHSFIPDISIEPFKSTFRTQSTETTTEPLRPTHAQIQDSLFIWDFTAAIQHLGTFPSSPPSLLTL